MGEPVKIVELAEELIRIHGMEPYKDVDIEFIGLRPGENFLRRYSPRKKALLQANMREYL